jgi:hypothetical protein
VLHERNVRFDGFSTGDIWPVGSLFLRNSHEAVRFTQHYFSVPHWPELVGLGEGEELIGFWLDLFLKWVELDENGRTIEEALLKRPGLSAFLEANEGKRVLVAKGQMIGPATLIWALKRRQYPVIDRLQIIDFLTRAFRIQGRLLERVGERTIVSLDEPIAFLAPYANVVWEEFFQSLSRFENETGVALHSCGTPDWSWLELPWKVVHFDVVEWNQKLSVCSPEERKLYEDFFERGSWLAIGVVPGGPIEPDEEHLDGLFKEFVNLHAPVPLENVMISTSCGIGIKDYKQLEDRMRLVERFQKELQRTKGATT